MVKSEDSSISEFVRGVLQNHYQSITTSYETNTYRNTEIQILREQLDYLRDDLDWHKKQIEVLELASMPFLTRLKHKLLTTGKDQP